MPVDLPTREDYFEIGEDEVISRSASRSRATRISPEAISTPGTDINIIIAACSAMADEATRHLALRMAALYLDSAEGEDLDRLVQDRFSPTVVRKQAAPAVVDVTFSRAIPPSAGLSGVINVGTKVRTEQGTEFTLTQAVGFPSGSTGPVSARAQAVRSGVGGNVDAGTIVQFVQTPFDNVITVTNAEPASGGTDVETDEALRERARDFFSSARRATLTAIEFGALSVDGVQSATAIELIDDLGFPTGYVQLYITDVNGQANTALSDAVRTELLEWRAAGIVVDVLTTTPLFIDIEYTVSFAAGTDTKAAIEALKSLTVATVNVLAPREILLRSMLFALARSIPGTIVRDNAVTTPTGDLEPTTGQVIKTSLDRVLVNGQ